MNDSILFSREWFYKWQWLLLLLINFPIKSLRQEIRYRLGIFSEEKINRLLPNCYQIKLIENKYKEIFYCDNIFAHKVKHELMFLWKIFHLWDNISYYLSPRLNLGYDTLYTYPDPGSGLTTCDGYLYKAGSSYSTIRNATNADSVRVSTSTEYLGSINDGSGNYSITRAIFNFNTSSINSQATIDSASISLTFTSYDLSATNLYFYLVTANPSSKNNIITSDYSKMGSSSLINNPLTTPYSDRSYTDTKNIINLSVIIKEGITSFGLRDYYDYNNSAPPSGVYNLANICFTDSGGNGRPKLQVIYTLPSKNNISMII